MKYSNPFKFTDKFSESSPGHEGKIKLLFEKVYFRRKRLVPLFVLLFAILVIPLLLKTIFGQQAFSMGATSIEDARYELPNAKKSLILTKEFAFPLRDNNGEEIDKMRYIIEKAEIRDEIIVKGKKATSVKGRTFLIVDLKLINNFNKGIEINTRDYVRLVVNNNEVETPAPDIHNDPVEVQAISTKYTRVGFPIDDNVQSLKLRVGEINGEKQIIELNFN